MATKELRNKKRRLSECLLRLASLSPMNHPVYMMEIFGECHSPVDTSLLCPPLNLSLALKWEDTEGGGGVYHDLNHTFPLPEVTI